MHMLITSDSVSEEISTVAHVEGEFLRARPISAENVAGESPSPPKSRGGNDLPLVPSAVGSLGRRAENGGPTSSWLHYPKY